MTTETNRLNRRKQKAAARKTFQIITHTCPACNAFLQRARMGEPMAIFERRGAALMEVHKRKTGCSGERPAPPPGPVDVNVICEGCGKVLLTEQRQDALSHKVGYVSLETDDAKQMHAHALEIRAKHMAETGCNGGDLMPEKIKAVAETELDALAFELGVSVDMAASIAAEAVEMVRSGDLKGAWADAPGDRSMMADFRTMADRVSQQQAAIMMTEAQAEHAAAVLGAPLVWTVDPDARGKLPPNPIVDSYLTEPARLDEDGTAEPKTLLSAPLGEAGHEGTLVIGPATTHIDRETGKRTELTGWLLGDGLSFEVGGAIHKKLDTGCCTDIGRRCECGGRIHMESVQGGIAYCCEACGSEKPGARA
jgi:hypothetical protein